MYFQNTKLRNDLDDVDENNPVPSFEEIVNGSETILSIWDEQLDIKSNMGKKYPTLNDIK